MRCISRRHRKFQRRSVAAGRLSRDYRRARAAERLVDGLPRRRIILDRPAHALAAEEVRAAQFGIAEGESDTEMVAIAKAIIAQRTGSFDPSAYRDRYQEALREPEAVS